MSKPRRVLVVGGTGNFGRLLCANLSHLQEVQVLLASRSLKTARATIKDLALSSNVEAVGFDRTLNLREQLENLAPWLVIDAAGPFQSLGYDLARAAIEFGAHFFDLADARGYLLGFPSNLDGLARAKGRVALAGASSTPALSAAVVAEITKGWQRRDDIDIAIMPDGRGQAGQSVVSAIMSYSGAPVRQFTLGQMRETLGWLNSRVIEVPGLGRRRIAPVETVDAEIMRRKFVVKSSITFSAGLESRLEMTGLRAIAWLRTKRLLRKPQVLVPILSRARSFTRRFAGQQGGMVVVARGVDAQGQWQQARWTMLAAHGQGMNVPGLPAIAATKLLLSGKLEPGGRIADDLPLADIEQLFAPLGLQNRVDRIFRAELFLDAIGPDATTLPKPIQSLHHSSGPVLWAGKAAVTRGKSLLARLIANIMRLPPEAKDVPVTVNVQRLADGGEIWLRDFGGHQFQSRMKRGKDGTVWESFSFGPLWASFRLGLRVEQGQLLYPVLAARLGGLPIPRFALPQSDTFEGVDARGRFNFSVRISMPLAGGIVHYKGWLEPQ